LLGVGNANERANRTALAENGVGKFNDINDAALTAIRTMGFSHIWLTGVLQQTRGTDYRQRPPPMIRITQGSRSPIDQGYLMLSRLRGRSEDA
jgi:hypothetical protein